jgi:hypothetical protein
MTGPGSVIAQAAGQLAALHTVRSARDYVEAALVLLPEIEQVGANDPRFFGIVASIEKAHALLSQASEQMDPESPQ